MTHPKRGDTFALAITLRTEKNCYAVLVDETGSRYFPIIITDPHLNVLEKVLPLPPKERNAGITDLGILSSFCYLMDMLGCQTDGVVIQWDDGGHGFDCHMNIFQENEVDSCMMALLIPMFEAPLVAAITGCPFHLYETERRHIALTLDESAEGKDIKEAVVNDIVKREKTI